VFHHAPRDVVADIEVRTLPVLRLELFDMLDAGVGGAQRVGFAGKPQRQIEVADRSFSVGIDHCENGRSPEVLVVTLLPSDLHVRAQTSLVRVGRTA
jgi:hypothetical protein